MAVSNFLTCGTCFLLAGDPDYWTVDSNEYVSRKLWAVVGMRAAGAASYGLLALAFGCVVASARRPERTSPFLRFVAVFAVCAALVPAYLSMFLVVGP
ncbi:hypothetical protein [Segniliparus rugosus]|uniref:Uncharacterized protein n=1 Tax=Segniliparus rugosus (strain ATCC BAA-974 / DSM 45345 / CCUG 50838 / CIP 108380 / JCM 13579 / CDC 945) TaxID=679197 RepID=E5XTC5_SEGRC|nr:hypothetical protein [Segniliparus rugosus]EFV12387.1 hypothetical protein HMPREF9336_02747 [Segniliparus rugosus ATCC BAA-974]